MKMIIPILILIACINCKTVPIIEATEKGELEDVKRLIDLKSDINESATGRTALMSASGLGNLEIVKLFIAAGVDVNYKNFLDQTALLRETEGNHTDIVKLLVSSGADVNAREGNDRQSSLNFASYNGNIEIVKFLLEKKALKPPNPIDRSLNRSYN